jgi:hypothetical protein
MKKLFNLLLILTMVVILFTGCSATVVPTSIKANWYLDTSQENIVYIDETIIYNVTYDATSATNTELLLNDFVGTYEMHLTTSDDLENYILTTKLLTSGKYNAGETQTEFSDSIETETYFKSVQNKLKPISSTKKYKGHSPLADNTIEYYEYEYKTEYEGSTATVTMLSHSDNIINKDEVKTYPKIDKSYTYFDNDQLLFAIRSLALTKGYSATIATVVPLDEQLVTLNVKVTDEEPYVTYNLKTDLNVTENGELLTDNKIISTIKTQISLNATMSGSTRTCYYAVNNTDYANYRSRLIKMEEPLPYNLGKFVYTINSVTFNETQR